MFWGILGEAELILRIWGARINTFRKLRNLGRSMHYFQESREHRPPGPQHGLDKIFYPKVKSQISVSRVQE